MRNRKGQPKRGHVPPVIQVLALFISLSFAYTIIKQLKPGYALWTSFLLGVIGLGIIAFTMALIHKKFVNSRGGLIDKVIITFDWFFGLGQFKKDTIIAKIPPLQAKKKFELIERVGRKCELCPSRTHPEVHHIVPRHKGGNNNLKNLIVLCPNCHSKADKGTPSRSYLLHFVKNRRQRFLKFQHQSRKNLYWYNRGTRKSKPKYHKFRKRK